MSKQTALDNIDKLIIALKDVVIEYKSYDSKFIANEIKNRMDCYNMSDRESPNNEQSGVRNNIYFMLDVIKDIDTM